MKLLQINEHYAPVGGVEQYLLETSAHLERRGVTVAVLYAASSDRLFHVPDRQEIHLACLRQASGFSRSQRFERVRQAIEQIAPDVIQVHNLDEPDVIEYLATLRPTVQFVHAHSVKFCPGNGKFYRRTQEVCRRPFGPYCLMAPYLHHCGSQRPWRIVSSYGVVRRWLEVVPKLSKLIVASHYMKQELISVGIDAEHLVVNPIGIDIHAGLVDEPLISLDPPVLLFVGRLYEVKGPHYLLAALEYIDMPCRVVIVGDGPEREQLRRMAANCPARHLIEFTGWIEQDELERCYRHASVVVVPSLWPEPFGLVGVEALKHGKPVVAFAVGGISEWLHDGENGFSVEVKNLPALAGAIKKILSDSQLAAAMSRQARRLAVERFNIERHVDTLLQIYQQACAAQQSKRWDALATFPYRR
ncbi:MAG: glycosyltransferase family 4 protein [Acidobacteriota bacterium]|nr:glycosyltransferase family 4 protein [Blastocatellia bacterium]MDW8238363.1 glycosyltransferase family 4 protein [Acidobacteriota bacterium]